jgi:hypothetical protein
MQIAVITCDRTPAYVHETLDSFWKSPGGQGVCAHLFVDGCDGSYLSRYGTSDMRPTWHHFLDEHEERRIRPYRAHQRACYGFLRALRESDEDILLVEDDVVFHPAWKERLQEMCDVEPHALVTLFTFHNLATHPHLNHRGHEYGKPVLFYGSCALYVPRIHRTSLASFVAERLGVGEYDAFDMLVGKWVDASQDHKLIAILPSVVDHLGAVSAIPENQSHGERRASSFAGQKR